MIEIKTIPMIKTVKKSQGHLTKFKMTSSK